MIKVNKIEVVPEPADLTYDFFDKPEKVGICSGNIFENDRPIGYYYSNTFFDSDEDLELYIGLKIGTGSFLVLAVRCKKGSTEKYRVVDPKSLSWEFNSGLDFNDYIFLQPDEVVNDELDQKAYSLIQEVIYADEGVFDYLDGGEPAYSVNNIGSCSQLGLIAEDEYPFNYVIWSLQFLVLSESELGEYIDYNFGEIEILYERIGSPLEAHLLDCNYWMPSGITWNDWIHSTNLMDRTIESDFKNLEDKFMQVLQDWIFGVSSENSKVENNYAELMKSLSNCRLLAQKILDKLGWSDRNPIISSQKLLSEYSWDR